MTTATPATATSTRPAREYVHPECPECGCANVHAVYPDAAAALYQVAADGSARLSELWSDSEPKFECGDCRHTSGDAAEFSGGRWVDPYGDD